MSTPNRSRGRVSGSVITVQRNTGPVLYLKLRDRTGRQHKRRLDPLHEGKSRAPVGHWTAKAAQEALREALVDLGREPDRGDQRGATLGDCAGAYLRYLEHERGRAPSTINDYRNTINGRILPALDADRPIATITTSDIDDLRRWLLTQVSRRTTQKTLVIVHGLFAYAKRRGWCPVNAATDAEKVTVARPTDFAVLAPSEVLHVARHAADQQLAAAIIVAAFTGLRLGELRALLWRHVDFANHLVQVRRSRPAHGRERAPKSQQARSVPLIDDAARTLDGLSRRDRFTGPDDHVFCTPTGTSVGDKYLRDGLYQAMAAARVGRDRGTGKPFVFHDLRHSFGTIAVQAFPLSDVRAYMGHADIQTTMLYVHHTPQHDAADRLARVVAQGAGFGYPAGTQTPEPGVPERI